MFRLAKLSLGNRALIALITVFASVFGVITMSSLKQELIPSVEFPQITVITSMPGASPEVVDKQISAPLETALGSVEGLESTSSTSRNGRSQITLAFTYGTNLDRARNQIDRAISTARQALPDDVQPQAIAGSISDFPIVFLAVSSDKPLSELNADLARLSVPRLQKLDGVRGADVTGGATQHIQILPRAADMAASGASIQSISDALKNNGALVPAGTIEEQGKTLSLQIGSPVDSLDAIKALPLGAARSAATIGSVADVSLVEDARTSITRTNGKETLALSVTKKPDGDTVAISHAVKDALPQLEAELGSNAKFTPVFDQAPFIEKSIKDLTTEGLLGLGFAVARHPGLPDVRALHARHGRVHPAVTADHVHRPLCDRLLAEHPDPWRADHRDRPRGGRLDRGHRKHQAAPQLRRDQDRRDPDLRPGSGRRHHRFHPHHRRRLPADRLRRGPGR